MVGVFCHFQCFYLTYFAPFQDCCFCMLQLCVECVRVQVLSIFGLATLWFLHIVIGLDCTSNLIENLLYYNFCLLH